MTARFQVLPPLSPEEFEALKRDIKARGVQVAVEYDDQGHIIEGHHRVRACKQLGITEWPRVVRKFDSDADKRTHARRLNLARRHLDTKGKRFVIAGELKDRPDVSNRQIACDLGVDDKTVADVRRGLERTAEIPQLKKTKGKDGVARPLKRPTYTGIILPGADGRRAIRQESKSIRDEQLTASRAERLRRMLPNVPLPDIKASIGVSDPPWPWESYGEERGLDRAPQAHYQTMTIEDICALPVADLFAADALLFLWITAPHLFRAPEVAKAWGFPTYVSNFVWDKVKPGQGYWARNQHEHLILFRRGAFPVPLEANRQRSLIRATAREHSRKPDEVYDLIDKMNPEPGLIKLELFARRKRPGWISWGNEVEDEK